MKHGWNICSRITKSDGEILVRDCQVIATTKGRAGSWAVNLWHKEYPGCAVKVKKITEIEMTSDLPVER